MFAITTRVRYQETDHGGRVYHANYLVWLDMCRTEYLRAKGIDYPAMEKRGTFLVVRKAELEYMGSAGYDDVVEVMIKRIERHKIRVDFYYDIVDNESRKLLISAFIQLVCVDVNGKPIKLPDQLNTVLIS